MFAKLQHPIVSFFLTLLLSLGVVAIASPPADAAVRPDRSFKVLQRTMPHAGFPYYRVKARNVDTIKRNASIYSYRTNQRWSKTVARGATFTITVPVRTGVTELSLQSLSTRESTSSIVERFEVRRGSNQLVSVSNPTVKRGYAVVTITNPYSTTMVANLGIRRGAGMVQGKVSRSVGPRRTVRLNTPVLRRSEIAEFNVVLAKPSFSYTIVNKRQCARP